MLNGNPIDTPDVTTDPPLQTPDEFVLCDFEPEEIELAAKELGPMLKNGHRIFENEAAAIDDGEPLSLVPQ